VFTFTTGLTDAMNSASRRSYEAAAEEEMRARQARLAAEEARIAQEHRQRQEDRLKDQQVGLSAIRTLAQMQIPTPPMGPQSPMPGAPSMPMSPPGAQSPMPGMDSAPPMEDNSGAPPPPAPEPPAVSPSWSPSAAASPELGGAPPPMPGAAPIDAPPPPPQMPRELPPQWLSVPNAIAAMNKANIPAEQQYQTLSKLMPIITRQNHEAVQDLQMQIRVAHAMEEAKRTAILQFRAENPRPTGAQDTAAIRNDKYFNGGAGSAAQGGRGVIVREDPNKPFSDDEKAWMAANGGPGAAPAPNASPFAPKPKAGAAAPAETAFTPGAIDVAAAEYIKTGKMPALYRDQATRAAIMNRAAEMTKEQGVDPGDVPGNRASFKADASSLAFTQKRVDQIDNSIKKIEKDALTLESVMDKGGSWTGAQFVNVPVNALRRQFNDPNLAKLDLAAKQVGVEYERMINGGLLSVAQLHEGAREDAAKIINGDMPASLIRAKLPLMRQEMANAKSSAAEQLAEIRGRMKGGKGGGTSDAAAPAAKSTTAPPETNAKGWKLMTDANGNKAYVSPDKKQYEEVN